MILLVLCLICSTFAVISLEQKKVVITPTVTAPKYRLQSQITTSGLSAGAFMAVQFGVAFSKYVYGTGVVAGGPFYCAQNSEITALTACMSDPSAIDVSTLVGAAKSAASNGDIDPLSNLGMFYLYSGLFDFTVSQGVVEALQSQLTGLGVPSANISTEFYIPSGHCMPTYNYGNTCFMTETPWINDCAYDGVGAFFNMFYSGLAPKGSTPSSLNLISINVDNYMPSGWTAYDASMSSTAYLYVSPKCAGNTTCSLHIAWHGCQQSYALLGTTYILHSGYVQWASTNNIIVLFPQTIQTIDNPSSCFDWWGFVNGNYAYKSSIQMSAFKNIAVALGAMY